MIMRLSSIDTCDRFIDINAILTINLLYLPDKAPCDFFIFDQLKLAIKGRRYADVEVFQMLVVTT